MSSTAQEAGAADEFAAAAAGRAAAAAIRRSMLDRRDRSINSRNVDKKAGKKTGAVSRQAI